MAHVFSFSSWSLGPEALDCGSTDYLWQKRVVTAVCLMLAGKSKNVQDEAEVPMLPPGRAPTDQISSARYHFPVVPQAGDQVLMSLEDI